VKRIKTSATLNAEAEAGDLIAELRAEVVKLSTQLLAAQAERQDTAGSPTRRGSSGSNPMTPAAR
jgi:hypothetical protein